MSANAKLTVLSTRPPAALLPVWPDACVMKDHSYRGFGVDPSAHELLMMNVSRDKYRYAWSFLNGSGRWENQGWIGSEIYTAYPLVALRGRAAHAVTIGDIPEPVKEWLDHKNQALTKDHFNFVYRRNFYTWTPDISVQGFPDLVELDSVDATGGRMSNNDL